MKTEDSDLLARFEAIEIDPGDFGHRDHVRVAFEMLHKYEFLDACTRYARAIRTLAANAGAPEKFNITITFAFLSLIAERIQRTDRWSGFDEFAARNEDLLSSHALDKWYSREQLNSDFARTHFLLPRNAA